MERACQPYSSPLYPTNHFSTKDSLQLSHQGRSTNDKTLQGLSAIEPPALCKLLGKAVSKLKIISMRALYNSIH